MGGGFEPRISGGFEPEYARWHVLRASVPVGGRSMTLLDWVCPEADLAPFLTLFFVIRPPSQSGGDVAA